MMSVHLIVWLMRSDGILFGTFPFPRRSRSRSFHCDAIREVWDRSVFGVAALDSFHGSSMKDFLWFCHSRFKKEDFVVFLTLLWFLMCRLRLSAVESDAIQAVNIVNNPAILAPVGPVVDDILILLKESGGSYCCAVLFPVWQIVQPIH
ncbi:hypothetical protein TIFTF001_025116 [Ficus carica]|uniref:Uncharacterized protein n=1 Tax=Ficus carica TaxID=3494 RepID=A0AA88AI73_FICCA|nr:hypothetical protein TIFTF001_025116 [Ficus carica]